MADPIFDIFREEARDHLGALEKLFLDLEAAGTHDARRELIDNLFRHAHSLKGDARVVGLLDLEQAAQALEDILDDLRESPERVDQAVIDHGLSQFDQVRQIFEAWDTRGRTEPEEIEPAATVRPRQVAAEHEETGGPEAQAASAEPPASPAPAVVPAAPRESFTVRVPSERLDRMLNLAGEIRVCQASLATLSGRLADLREYVAGIFKAMEWQPPVENRHSLEAVLDQVRHIENDLRKKRSRENLLVGSLEAEIRQARLLPLVMLADALRRAARDVAQSLGKSIRYEAGVGTIMLDKGVIEALRQPLLHLIRNAADHGIEPSDQRQAAGKPEEGSIRISASQRGELVSIAVSDDGRGVNFEAIRQRLRQAGDVDEAEVRGMTDQQLAEFLFRPGFTTATAGDVSGRGVGLDVVLTTVRRLQGTVKLHESSPAGTTFVVTVPVTVSTIRILTVFAGGQSYGIPCPAVVRTGCARRADLREMAGGPVLPIDGVPVRWVPLVDLVGVVPTQLATEGETRPYLLIADQGRQMAVAVDELEDESEVLLKPLEFPLNGLPGIYGATIRPDGLVQLVLNLSRLPGRRVETVPPRVERRSRGRILVVDDSPTTRAVLRSLLMTAGYSVGTAADGVEALERLRSQPVELVVADVEMPRMNGFDLTRQVKAKFAVPVILVTAREKEDQRREGLEAGADAYVVKSTFEGEGLLDIIAQFL